MHSARRFVIGLMAVALAFFAVPAPAAHANASGCTYFSGADVPSFGWVPTKGVCVKVVSNGLNPPGFFQGQALGQVCNWRFVLKNISGRTGQVVKTWTGSYHSGCVFGPVSYSVPDVTFVDGSACAQLYEGGRYINQACVYVHP